MPANVLDLVPENNLFIKQALTNQILSDARSRTRVLPYLFIDVLPY